MAALVTKSAVFIFLVVTYEHHIELYCTGGILVFITLSNPYYLLPIYHKTIIEFCFFVLSTVDTEHVYLFIE
jgi:hypothetical protein